MKSDEKAPVISPEHKEALRELFARPEFEALRDLFHIEEDNIVIASFKVPSSDPEIARKKAHSEGRIFELRKILNTFKEVSMGGEDEEN